jgi:outer membrane immunogenic protein
MKKTLLLGIGLTALGMTSAFAADLPARAPVYTKAPAYAPMYDWSGFYAGLNVGGGSSHDCYTLNSVAGTAINPVSEGCHSATGALAGGQVGYRWQMTNWVFGVEAQGDWTNLRGSNASLTAITPYTNQTKTDAIGLFTGQIGYAWNNVLLYAKGGAAVTDNKYNSFFTGNGIVFNTTSDTRWGGAVGAGLEYGFAPNWSVGIEYDHLFMGRPNISFPARAINAPPFTGAVGRSDNVSQGVDIGMIRVNYRFGGPMIAKY